MDKSCCFIGHRKIEEKEIAHALLKKEIELLLEKGVTTFYFGSMSDFDDLSWNVVSELKNKNPLIKRIYVRSSFQFIDKAYEEYLLKSFEETYFPNQLENAGRCSYVERNYEMIDKSRYCVFYYNKDYTPLEYRKSGTKIAHEYAVKKQKEIINIYKKPKN